MASHFTKLHTVRTVLRPVFVIPQKTLHYTTLHGVMLCILLFCIFDKTQVYITRHENLYGVFFRSGFCNFAVTLHGRVIV